MAGRAVVANPLHGCTPLENEKKVAGRLLVAERGACMFIEKALQAQAAGAVGLVIYDTGAHKMQSKGQQPKGQQEQQAGSGTAQPQAPSASPSPADSAGQQSSEPGAAAPPPTQGAPFAPFSMSGDGVHDKQIRIPIAFIENAHGIDLLELIRTAESEQDAAIVIAPQAVLSCMNSGSILIGLYIQ